MATAAQLFVECLENEGVEYVFGIPGEETLDLNEALDRSRQIAFIPVRHEQGGAFMADAYGRLTGRAGVCLGTLGPGATNLVTKWNTSVHDPTIIPEAVRKAFAVAEREKPGATHLELPADVMETPTRG